MIWFVKGWRRFISPIYGDVCRYHPSCSAYGLRSLEVHGAVKGGWLTVSRIVRCNPWSAGGYDPVPGTREAMAWQQEQTARAGQVVTQDADPDGMPPVGEAPHHGPERRPVTVANPLEGTSVLTATEQGRDR